MSSRIRWRALEAGRGALAALDGSGAAPVFAAFERSCYVQTPGGMACVGGPAIGRGPLNVLVSEPFSVPHVGDAIVVDTDAVRVWDPAPIDWPHGPMANALERLGDLWAERRPGEGLAALVDAPERVPSRARMAAERLLDWIERDAPELSPRAAHVLIGWGGGLTPSGDDFVGGALLALRALRRERALRRLTDWALRAAAVGTSRISRAHLRCAAEGHAHEAVRGFLAALGGRVDEIGGALAALSRLGHTSGWDTAVGVLLTSSRSLAASPPG